MQGIPTGTSVTWRPSSRARAFVIGSVVGQAHPTLSNGDTYTRLVQAGVLPPHRTNFDADSPVGFRLFVLAERTEKGQKVNILYASPPRASPCRFLGSGSAGGVRLGWVLQADGYEG